MFEVLTTDEFDRWLSDLADERARTRIASRELGYALAMPAMPNPSAKA
jgi:putative component of toxin-antitoxin plasmid stabilization module